MNGQVGEWKIEWMNWTNAQWRNGKWIKWTMDEWINGCTLDEGKTRNTRTTWTLPSLSLSLSRLALYCLCCVARGNKQTSISICVCHPSTEIKRGRGGEAQEANKRIGEDGGCGEGVCAGVSGSWLMTMARSNGLWPLLPMVGLFLVYTSVHAIAKLDIHLLDNGEILISFVFSYFFYFLFF